MKPKLGMFGTDIEVDVPHKETRKYKKRGARVKAPLQPEHDKMIRSPVKSKTGG